MRRKNRTAGPDFGGSNVLYSADRDLVRAYYVVVEGFNLSRNGGKNDI